MPATRATTLFITAVLAVLSPVVGARDRDADRGGHSAAARGDRLAVERLDAAPGEPDTVAIAVDEDARRRLLNRGRGLVRDFPLPGHGAVDLELEAFDVLAPRARVVAVTDGIERDLPRPTFRAFRGRVVGDPDSLVVLGFFDRRLAGFVRTWHGEFAVEPGTFNAARAGAGELRVRRVDPDAPRQFGCDDALDAPRWRDAASGLEGDARTSGRAFAEASGRAALPAAPRSIDGDTLLESTIAIDATSEFYAHLGSLSATEDYILNLMAQVSAIYESEINTKVLVGYLRVFTNEPDPYTDGSLSTSVLLADLRSEWTASMGGIARSATHLFSVRPSGGSGLAYVDVLCSSSYGYGVSSISALGQSWEKDLVAHEIGHNFASPHTHCYVPEIDQCANQGGCYQGTIVPTVGTIMSYCGSSQSVFHPRVKSERLRPAVETAYPSCVETAGLPGTVAGGGGAGLLATRPAQCATATPSNDDGGANGSWGYGGTSQMIWVKRFTPGCYPFAVEGVDVMINNGSVAPGRAIRLLVYVDPTGSGDPANAVLAYEQDVTVQVVSSATLNQYALTDPVFVSAGDYYVGFYDLVADPDTTYIAARDTSREGDAWYGANTNDPGGLTIHSGGTWLIRTSGGAVPAGSVLLSWDLPCNAVTTPDQDFAIYHGVIGAFDTYDSLTCSTARATTHMAPDDGQSRFYLVVPRTAAAEGSYGTAGGVERPASPTPCKPQGIGTCN